MLDQSGRTTECQIYLSFIWIKNKNQLFTTKLMAIQDNIRAVKEDIQDYSKDLETIREPFRLLLKGYSDINIKFQDVANATTTDFALQNNQSAGNGAITSEILYNCKILFSGVVILTLLGFLQRTNFLDVSLAPIFDIGSAFISNSYRKISLLDIPFFKLPVYRPPAPR